MYTYSSPDTVSGIGDRRDSKISLTHCSHGPYKLVKQTNKIYILLQILKIVNPRLDAFDIGASCKNN